MGVIIRMDSEKLVNKFLPSLEKFSDLEGYEFILISENITFGGDYTNVKAIERLLPPQTALSAFVDKGSKAFKREYLEYLEMDAIDAFVSIIVHAAVLKDMKIVLVCSPSEDEFGYLKVLCDYIEKTYEMSCYTFKSYIESPEKAMKVKNAKEIGQVLAAKFKRYSQLGINMETEDKVESFKRKIFEMDKPDLKAFAKKQNIKLDKDMSRKEMAKKICKKILAS